MRKNLYMNPIMPAKTLVAKACHHPGQYWVEGEASGREWEDRHVSFNGYYGSYGPNLFAAAPELLSAAKELAAAGIPATTGRARAAREALFAAIRMAEQDAPAPPLTLAAE